MASSLPRVIDDDLLQCKLCCRKAVDPKLLPCLHVFCGRCLDRHLAKASVLEPRKTTLTTKPKSDYKDKSASDGNDRKPDQRSGTCPDTSREKKKKPPVEETPASEGEDDSYEIPQRTIDEYGYQIADEDAFKDGLYDNDDVDNESYYNRTAPSGLSVQPYTDMTNQGNKRKKRPKKSSKRGKEAEAATLGDQVRTMRTMSELSGEYVGPGGEGDTPGTGSRCPSDLYDNIEDPLETGFGAPVLPNRSVADRKLGSPSDVRRWKVSGATAPPLLVRRPKGSRNATDSTVAPPVGSETSASDLRKEETVMSAATAREPSSRSAALQDIYTDDGESSPPMADLYGSTNTAQASTAVYKLQMRISNDYASHVQPLTGFEHDDDEGRHTPPAENDESGLRCRKFQCPVCEEPVTTSEDGTFATCSFVGAMQEMSSCYTEGQSRCNNCDFKPATHLCFDCRQNFCNGCREAHNWLKITQTHRVASLCDVRLGKHQTELQDMIASRCSEHAGNVTEFLCISCQRIVCSECMVSAEHDNHWAAPIDNVASREKDYIESLMESVKRNLDKVTLERNNLDSYRLRSDDDRIAVIRDIAAQKETLIRLVETFCASLVEKVEKEYTKERRRIEDGLSRLDRFRLGMQHSCKVVGQLLDHGRPTDIALLSKAAKSRLHALEKASPPVTDGTLGVAFRPTVIAADDIEQMFGVLTIDKPDLTGPTRKLSPADTEAATSVTPRLLWSFPTKTVSDDKGCKPTGVAVVPESDEVVLVDDINKKIKVFRSDGTLVRELCPTGERRLIDPWDVVVLRGETGTGNLLAVTDRGARDVKVFTESGEFMSSFGPHLGNPWGIATNSIGNILVTDITHRKVFVHDAAGNLLSSIPSEKPDRIDASLRCPEYVTVNVNDDVVVSDFELHSVLIFDKFGRFVARYGDRNEAVRRLKVPCGVTVDREGDIYIADYNNRRIVRLTRNGRLVCHYATNDTHLVMPQTLAFNCDGNLVVVDRTHVKVFAVTDDCTDGSDKPRPKPRKKTEDVRRKSNPTKKRNPSSQPQTVVRGLTSLPLIGLNGKTKTAEGPEGSGANEPIVKQFLETEVW